VLKFFIYLTDTDEHNGAMRVLPGSNLRNRHDRERAMRDINLNDIANVLPEPQTPSIPVCGPAGTLFVFDTDVCHGASAVEPGRHRRTMRGHTHAHSMLRAMGVH
jgi:ectoine hydroxylase-related dioxygenase (phytanoyl-CoA dioxygenase family)